MFGYVRPDNWELKVKDTHKYRDYYCCLCYQLRKDYGLLSGCLFNYDITFLLLVLDSTEKEGKEKYEFRCPLNPFHKCSATISPKALEYSAFINYYLVKMKFDDDIADDRRRWKRIVFHVLLKILTSNKRFKNKAALYTDVTVSLEEKMNNVYSAENAIVSYDDISIHFRLFFEEIFRFYFEKKQNSDPAEYEPFLQMVSFLGEWIYLMDAYDDYQNDIKSNSFNLLDTLVFDSDHPSFLDMEDRVRKLTNLLIFRMKEQVNRIPYMDGKDIFDNIVTFGCAKQFRTIYSKKSKMIDRNENCNCENRLPEQE